MRKLLLLLTIFVFVSCTKDEDKNSQKQIINFKIDAVNADINQQTKSIDLVLPEGDITKLTPIIEVSPNAIVSPKSGEQIDFTNTVVFTVIAEDGTKEKYHVTISVGSESNSKRITSFALKAEGHILPCEINEETKTISVETQLWIPTPEALIASFETTGVKVAVANTEQTTAITANDFRTDIVYTVTAQNGTSANYTVSLLSPQTSGLPVMSIDIDNGKEITEKTDEYDNAFFKLIDYNNPEFSFEKETGIRGRGNSTWAFPKKPYRIKFDKKTSIFGLGAEKSWVLLANYLDPTVMMNDVALELGRRFGLEFTNHSFHVELFINGTYRGNYQLTEQVQVNKNRVNIDEQKGFFIEMDDMMDEDWCFYTNIIRLPVMVKSPEAETAEEIEFVKKAMNDLDYAMFGDPTFPNNNYKDLIDIPSLIDFILVNEITRNHDINHPKSIYAYKKDENSKIFWGPIWDFDRGFGYDQKNFDYFVRTNMMFYKGGYDGKQAGSRFFNRFFDDPDFCKQYKERWNVLKTTQINSIVEYITAKEEILKKPQIHNYARWDAYYTDFTFDNQIEKMKDWLEKRIIFLDKEINKF